MFSEETGENRRCPRVAVTPSLLGTTAMHDLTSAMPTTGAEPLPTSVPALDRLSPSNRTDRADALDVLRAQLALVQRNERGDVRAARAITAEFSSEPMKA
jgi:hypothetical protein